ncbi:MAG: patatin-like phospholipase family protein [Holosporales bacterium]|nr:patatin-like phospholipase family protein [Holosporales bacterium]
MKKKRISIALQGGGLQSAFAWGVLDLFLQDERLEITGISSTGLGGIAGTALMQGLIDGGEASASAMLREYWIGFNKVSKSMAQFLPNPLEKMISYYSFSDSDDNAFKSGIGPYDRNPLNVNPLLDFIESFFDFHLLNEETEKKIFISTTHVETGKIKVFENKDLSPKVLMASFCLPFIFHSVEIDGEHYWDGGMIANPAINPIIDGVSSKDIIVIQLVKNSCVDIPQSHHGIESRIREISYNALLLREMRAIYFISKLIDDGKVISNSLKRINMHVIKNDADIADYSNKNFSSDWGAIMDLYTDGYKTAKRWLSANYDSIGAAQSTLSENVFGAYV